MLFTDALELRDDAELFLTDGVGRTLTDNIVTKVAGPYYNGISGAGVMLVRYKRDQKLHLHNLSDLVVKPEQPVEGETWVRRDGGAWRYVAAVTEAHVILKHDSGRPDNKAYLMTLNEFVRVYKKA